MQAYLYDGYWEDIGTIEAFYNANLGITKKPVPDFSFYDRSAPIYTQPRYLPPSKMLDADVTDSVIGEGCVIKVKRNTLSPSTLSYVEIEALHFLCWSPELQNPPFRHWSSVLHIGGCNHRRHLVDGRRLLRGMLHSFWSNSLHLIESGSFLKIFVLLFWSFGFRLMRIGHSWLQKAASQLALAETLTLKELSLTRMLVLVTTSRSFSF